MANQQTFWILTLQGIPLASEDQLTAVCFEFGATGVSEDLSFEQKSLRYEPLTLTKDFIDLQVYFDQDPGDNFVDQVLKLAPQAKVAKREEPIKDWNAEWKKSFIEFELVDGVWVVPSWREIPKEARQVIRIDPGMAFGTGTHETTQLASEALSILFKNGPSKAVLDVGTGTGILAILASLLGAAQVRATEIDEAARGVARENIAINNITNIEVLEHQVEDEKRQYDIVLANIIDGVLIDIQEPLKNALNPSGHLIVTGILQERETLFLKEFLLPQNYIWTQRLQKGEWLGFIGSPTK